MQVRMRPMLLVIILGALALLLGLVVTWFPREPTYKGRTIAEWAASERGPERYEALLILATNNLHLLVQRIAYDPKKDRLVSLYSHLPSRLRKQRWLSDFVGRKNSSAFNAMGALYQLGPLAAPELPHLLQIAKQSDYRPAMSALSVIGDMGETACPALISLTGHQNQTVAATALTYLAAHTNSVAARQALTNALHDPRPVVRMTAEAALAGRLSQ